MHLIEWITHHVCLSVSLSLFLLSLLLSMNKLLVNKVPTETTLRALCTGERQFRHPESTSYVDCGAERSPRGPQVAPVGADFKQTSRWPFVYLQQRAPVWGGSSLRNIEHKEDRDCLYRRCCIGVFQWNEIYNKPDRFRDQLGGVGEVVCLINQRQAVMWVTLNNARFDNW